MPALVAHLGTPLRSPAEETVIGGSIALGLPLLLHDLAHYAAEEALGTDAGFYGLLACGYAPSALREEHIDDPTVFAELLGIERVVVRLQNAFKRDPDAATALPGGARLCQLWGAWRKTRQGQALVLRWPPAAPTVMQA